MTDARPLRVLAMEVGPLAENTPSWGTRRAGRRS